MSSFLKQFNKKHIHQPQSDTIPVLEKTSADISSSAISIPRSLPGPIQMPQMSPTKSKSIKGWFSEWSSPHTKKNYIYNDKYSSKGIFDVSLQYSMSKAQCEIVMANRSDGKTFGYVPVVIAKCGSIIKTYGTKKPGLFRKSGNKKKVDYLINYIFTKKPCYGLDFKYDDKVEDILGPNNYSIHEFTSVFKIFLNRMNEPVVPLCKYNPVLEILKKRPSMIKYYDLYTGINTIDKESLRYTEFEQESREMLEEYIQLIGELPEKNRDLLIYILDLLNIINKNQEGNLMTSENLSIVFQPAVLSHPEHAMDIKEARIARYTIQFWIQNFDTFVQSFFQ